MAIEKMYMMNVVGTIENLDKFSKYLVLEKCIQPISALSEINSSDFLLETSQDNLEAIIDVCYIRPYEIKDNTTDTHKLLKKMAEAKKKFKIKDKKVNKIIYKYDICEKKIKSLYEKFSEKTEKYELIIKKEEVLSKSSISLAYLKDVDKDLKEIKSMKNFDVALYKTKLDNMKKLEDNYENIPSIIQVVYRDKDESIFLSLSPKVFKTELNRIFDSAACEELIIPEGYEGTPYEVSQKLKDELVNTKKEKDQLKEEIKSFLRDNNEEIYICEKSEGLERLSQQIKRKVACTNEFFYLCGWVPESMLDAFDNVCKNFGNDVLVIKKTANEVNNTETPPPTKLDNSPLFKPFEIMVDMYGTPTYGEIDPTIFLAITYTVIFGAMFGDVGQGLVLFLIGLSLKYKKGKIGLGGILARLGISSTIFGFLYGSVFGSEEIISAILVRPMEDIEDVLLWAVVFGCILLILGFILGIINRMRRKDYEQGVFGKDGIAGLTFYVTALLFILTKVLKIDLIPNSVFIIILVSMLVLILLKQPISNLIQGKKPLFNDGPKDYFIEASFEVIETVLSMFSNTVSFIRVGAFALNHVGLFIAFAAMADMMNHAVGSAFILILGNIIIICLEGLIVFIQGLRLQYYELFSKYYDGAGIEFKPVGLSL